MRAAARAVAGRRAGTYHPKQQLPGIMIEPKKNEKADDNAFYGWAFQDSDGYKWLEAVSYQLMLEPDQKLREQAQQAVDAICAAQEDDGYLDTFYSVICRERAFTNLKDHHELYCFGHLTEAAVAWRQATGSDQLLNAAVRFGECIAARFGPKKQRGCPGHEIAEMALYRLYEQTGDSAWKELADFFLDVRGTEPSTFAIEENIRRKEQGLDPLPISAKRYAYYQAHIPVRDMRDATGHAVRQMYLCCSMADAARENGDPDMFNACKRLWHSAVREKMYVTGGVGGTHVGEAFSRPYDLPADTAYSETCAAIGLAFFARRMLQLEADSQYADVMELALYNTVLAGMSLDGKRFFYVNPLEVVPEACESDSRLSHVKPERQKWFSCACCPPNIARLISSLPAYIATQNEHTAYIHLYIGSRMRFRFDQGEITVNLEADLLKNGRATLTVIDGRAMAKLAFRVPAWTREPSIQSTGKQAVMERGYCILSGDWKKGDTVKIDLPMPVRALAASPMVREAAGKICIRRGPLIYCAEEADNGTGLHLLRVNPHNAEKAELERIRIADIDLPVIDIPGKRVCVKEAERLYFEWKAPEETDVRIRLIPYFAWSNRGKGEMSVWLNRK